MPLSLQTSQDSEFTKKMYIRDNRKPIFESYTQNVYFRRQLYKWERGTLLLFEERKAE